MRLRVAVVVEPEDGGGFHAYCPALKGLHVDGDTEAEALQNAKTAAILYIESLQRNDDPLPVGPSLSGERESSPPGWMVHDIELPWPSPSASGIN
jgi:predicted RNase H-like HicB family nuclease